MRDKEAFTLINQLIGFCLNPIDQKKNKKLRELGRWTEKLIQSKE